MEENFQRLRMKTYPEPGSSAHRKCDADAYCPEPSDHNPLIKMFSLDVGSKNKLAKFNACIRIVLRIQCIWTLFNKFTGIYSVLKELIGFRRIHSG